MAQATDFTAAFKDMFNAFPMNANPFEDAIKNSLALNEKLAGVALEAAEKTKKSNQKKEETRKARAATPFALNMALVPPELQSKLIVAKTKRNLTSFI